MNFEKARFKPVAQVVEGGYVYHDPRIVLAVNVALATGRPLFVTGAPGAGKSTLAGAVARDMGWAYVASTVTSRTRLDDLVARYDAVARLNDAQNKEAGPPEDYLVPGVLWWAFRPDLAEQAKRAADRRGDPSKAGTGIVVLLDEMDKAEPDLPNDLLGPLDGYRIDVPGHGVLEAATPVLVVITSNGERTMPPAFLRRCVVLELDDSDPEFFVQVATSHYGARDDTLYVDVAARTIRLAETADVDRRRKPSMAEYLDTVRACREYEQWPGNDETEASPIWHAIEEAALRKTRGEASG